MSDLTNIQPSFLHTSLEAGQEDFAQKMRIVLHKTSPELFGLLDYYDDHAFLEPHLFSYFVDPNTSLRVEQLLLGYIPEQSRPSIIPVYADQWGTVELPNIGYLRTDNTKSQLLSLHWIHEGQRYGLTDKDSTVTHTHQARWMVNGTSIEICRYNSPLWSRFFVDSRGNPLEVDVECITYKQVRNVNRAFDIIKYYIPSYYEQIARAVKKVVLFQADGLYSFASPTAHGVAFLNTSLQDDEVFFVEDLVHQCGHVVFTAITQNLPLFTIPPETPLKQITGDEHEPRDVFTALHGIYTETWMNLCLHLCCDDARFSPRQRHELLGRFTYILTRFGIDLRSLSVEDIFTEHGRQLMAWFEQVYRYLVDERYDLLSQFDVSGQPYCFDYTTFAELNPLSEPSTSSI